MMDKFLITHPNCWAIVWSPTSKMVEVLNQVRKTSVAPSYITPEDVPAELGLTQNDQLIIIRPDSIPYGVVSQRAHDVLEHISSLERKLSSIAMFINGKSDALSSDRERELELKLDDMTAQRDGALKSLNRARRDYDEQLSNIIAENTTLRSDAMKLAVVSARLEELARSVSTPELAQALRDLLNT